MIAATFIHAFALAAGAVTTPAETASPIYGGAPVELCAFPSTVNLEGSCTATLVHPELIVYAWHCGEMYSEVWFGEDFRVPARKVAIDYCEVLPDGGVETGRDVAYCRLAEPVLDVPIVPLLAGCEVEAALKPGRKAALVGFGVAEDEQDYGPKRAVTAPIKQWNGDLLFIGGDGKDTCQGDSGGPAFVRLVPGLDPGGDGTWRLVGITSFGAPCGAGGFYTAPHKHIGWLESASGLDLTPCHGDDGAWEPGARCGGSPLHPDVSAGDWASGCGDGAVGGLSATCGAPFPETPDTTPPTVAVVTPGDGSVFDTDAAVLPVLITVVAEDVGWGVQDVRLRLDGADIPDTTLLYPPFLYDNPPLDFPPGTYTLEAVARDLAGNTAVSAPVRLRVGAAPDTSSGEPPETTGGPGPVTTSGDAVTGDGTTGDGTTGEGSTGDGATGGQAADDDGCGCRTAPRGADLTALAVLALLRRRRRAGVRDMSRRA